jgi:hypothetical protein
VSIVGGNKNKSGAKIRISIAPITDPKINPNHNTKPVIIKPVTIIFHNNLKGNKNIFSTIYTHNTQIQPMR